VCDINESIEEVREGDYEDDVPDLVPPTVHHDRSPAPPELPESPESPESPEPTKPQRKRKKSVTFAPGTPDLGKRSRKVPERLIDNIRW